VASARFCRERRTRRDNYIEAAAAAAAAARNVVRQKLASALKGSTNRPAKSEFTRFAPDDCLE